MNFSGAMVEYWQSRWWDRAAASRSGGGAQSPVSLHDKDLWHRSGTRGAIACPLDHYIRSCTLAGNSAADSRRDVRGRTPEIGAREAEARRSRQTYWCQRASIPKGGVRVRPQEILASEVPFFFLGRQVIDSREGRVGDLIPPPPGMA